VRLDVRGIDHLRLGRSATSGKLTEQPFPHAALRPADEAIVDCRRRTVLRRAIAPPAAALQHMKDAADHSSIVCAILAAHVRGKERRDAPPLVVAQPEQVPLLCSF